MIQVNFYILEANKQPAAELQLACRLAEKALQQQLSAYLYVATPMIAQQLDELLWSFRDTSFVPHGKGDCLPIGIGVGVEPPTQRYQALINLSQAVVPFHHQFERIIEIVPAEPNLRKQARERYVFYRGLGYQLQSHTLKK